MQEGGLVGIRLGDRISAEILELGDGKGERTYQSIPQCVAILGFAQSRLDRDPYPRLRRGKRPRDARFEACRERSLVEGL